MKDTVKRLIGNGQLEITQGGWVANDEACTNYEDIIMQMYMGHQFLKKEFGVTPRVGWMIDAFGHSAANAALFADFGFDALYFSRIEESRRAGD
jgi:alpha-mannosidase